MSVAGNGAGSGIPIVASKTRLGRWLGFYRDQLSGMRLSFGSGGHEQKLTLTFSFLSSFVVSVLLLTLLWALAAGWLSSGDHYAGFYAQTSVFGDAWYATPARVIASALLTLGVWLVASGEAVGVTLLVFITATCVGAIVGFLFGIPRPLSESGPGAASAAAASSAANQATTTEGTGSAAAPSPGSPPTPPPRAQPGWYANTNLTQVSDWLTKIIVGVGLVEATRVGGVAKRINDYVDPALFDGKLGTSLVMPVLMLIGLFVGFMYCYLFTQLFLAALMAQTADALYHNIDLFQANTAAFVELFKIQAAASEVAPAIRVPQSAAPMREPTAATADQTRAAIQIQSFPLDAVDDPASLAIWARAGAVLNSYGSAVAGYVKLLAKRRTPEILAEAARVFASANDLPGARRLLDEAVMGLRTADPATRARIVFDAAHLALYDRAPGSYERALALLDDPDVMARDKGGGLHILHACALGQRYSFETRLNDGGRASIRSQILDDLRTALESPDNRSWVLYLLGRNPDGSDRPTKLGRQEDDDLFAFKDDPEFLALVNL